MEVPSPRKAPRRPPSLRWAWVVHLCCALIGVVVGWMVVIMIFDADAPGWVTNPAIVAAMLSFQLGLAQFAQFQIRRKLAAKAPGLCPACECILDVTKATPADEPIRCPECGYADTAGGVRLFWKIHVGKPSP